MQFHGIITNLTGLWLRVISGVSLLKADEVVEEFDGGPYRPAFLDHFFPGQFRVEVRKLHEQGFNGRKSATALPKGTSVSGEVIRFSNESDQYVVRLKGDTGGWLTAFEQVGLTIRNSRKISKRLIEIVRLASAWTYRSADLPLAIEVIEYNGPGSDVDGISAISQELFLECISSNKGASKNWRRAQRLAVKNGKTAVVSLRIITPMGLIKGNALVLPKWMMGNMDVRTFRPNIKSEIRSEGWYWVTVDPSYGAIPVKSDDLTHSIYRGVKGLYDDEALLGSFRSMLLEFFKDLKSGKRSAWMESLADNADDILHDKEAFDKYAKNRGLVGRIQLAVAQLAAVGVPLTASQTLMFLSVNGLKKQLLGETKPGQTWQDKSKHWFPVPWAYAAHVMTQEALRVFGFYIPETDKGFYHQDTHCFVVPGKFFAENYENHGGYDLDDTIKVHIRQVGGTDGAVKLMAILLRNPNDFGEWSMIEVDDFGPVFHQYGEEPPTVELQALENCVPQWTGLKKSLTIGGLPAVTNPIQIGRQFSRDDEERVRRASQAFPAGVGGTVIPKMIWYATTSSPIQVLCAPNEDIIDVLQQGQGSQADMDIIQGWIDATMLDLRQQVPYLDAFWWHTRLPKPYKEAGWECAPVEESSWVDLHLKREQKAREALKVMTDWLNANVVTPQVLSDIIWTEDELTSMEAELTKIQAMRKQSAGWVQEFVEILSKTDESKGEEYVDRKVLRLAYASLVAKERYPRGKHDQWLFSLTKEERQPVDWYIRALQRVQDGTYNW